MASEFVRRARVACVGWFEALHHKSDLVTFGFLESFLMCRNGNWLEPFSTRDIFY